MRWMSAWAFAALLCAAPMAMAQWTVIADVPFPFAVGDMKCPAAEYRFIRNAADTTKMVVMRNVGTGEGILFVASFFDANYSPKAQAKLVFTRYGDRHFLRGVHEGSGLRIALMPGAEERQLQVAGLKREKAVVLARVR